MIIELDKVVITGEKLGECIKRLNNKLFFDSKIVVRDHVENYECSLCKDGVYVKKPVVKRYTIYVYKVRRVKWWRNKFDYSYDYDKDLSIEFILRPKNTYRDLDFSFSKVMGKLGHILNYCTSENISGYGEYVEEDLIEIMRLLQKEIRKCQQ